MWRDETRRDRRGVELEPGSVGDDALADSSERESMSISSTSSVGGCTHVPGVFRLPPEVAGASPRRWRYGSPALSARKRARTFGKSRRRRRAALQLRGDGRTAVETLSWRTVFDLRDQQAERSGPLEVEHLASGVGVTFGLPSHHHRPTIRSAPVGQGHRARFRASEGWRQCRREFGNPFLKHLAEEVEDRPRPSTGRVLATKLIGLPDHVEEFADAAIVADTVVGSPFVLDQRAISASLSRMPT